jgi:hypothetical protein
MLDPWESLRVNAKRQILVGDNGSNSNTVLLDEKVTFGALR